MTANQVIRFYGNKDAACNALANILSLKMSRQLLEHWDRKGIPLARQSQIQLATRGKLKAEK